ncbi:MAG: hypothetical protein EOM59_13510 [Clostridia bacterium]|jgi:hypothetical protein|nr:hypothetical protein [Clostridia bacterium]
MMTEQLIGSVVEQLASELEDGHKPFYFYGSPVSIQSEMVKTMNASGKYPAIILFNEFQETKGETMSHFGRSANITLYFMQNAGKNWSEKKHIDNAVIPMNSIADLFIELIEADKRFGDVDDLKKTHRTNWGLILQQASSKRSVFPDVLSGIEISFTLKIKRNYC